MAGDKYDNAGDKRAYCPFFKGTIKHQKIVCEGPIARTNVWVTFSTPKRMKDYMERYCYGKACEGCMVYQCANAKYEEE